ncbi:heavy-metal-associated domain-containing protein [Celeribacter neptunius]|uniref:Copper chaperone n=1 Tax=Celeribacter neptunius TaxID=588602 RepID=A0A1I3UXJ9_9RHOB|nr:heavy-metal-associated domain-containing protein [Celeribacter neptunius]SFJ86591.1 copper chaperone [Celeribacter neptunius]
MSVFSVPDMSCGHCKATITEALEAIDDTVEIDADMEAREIDVFSDIEDAAILDALKKAGYPATIKT